VPEGDLVVDGPRRLARAALDAAAAGDHRPAAEILAETRRRARWADRSHLVDRLTDRSLRDQAWLTHWQDADPMSPDLRAVAAHLKVKEAWVARTHRRARDVSHDQFQAFFDLLGEAVPLARVALELDPSDPEPWVVSLIVCRGLQLDRAEFDHCLDGLLDAAPQHYAGHRAALEYVTAKWLGSHEAMFDYADWAADSLGPGTRLETLPLVAWFEFLVANRDEQAYAARRGAGEAALARALRWADDAGTDDPLGAVETRNLAAYVLHREGAAREAYEQFRLIGGQVASYPWSYFGDPRERFVAARDAAVDRCAASP